MDGMGIVNELIYVVKGFYSCHSPGTTWQAGAHLATGTWRGKEHRSGNR